MNKSKSWTVFDLENYTIQLWNRCSKLSNLSSKDQKYIQENLISVAKWCKNPENNHSQSIIQELYKMLYFHIEENLNSKNWINLANH